MIDSQKKPALLLLALVAAFGVAGWLEARGLAKAQAEVEALVDARLERALRERPGEVGAETVRTPSGLRVRLEVAPYGFSPLPVGSSRPEAQVVQVVIWGRTLGGPPATARATGLFSTWRAPRPSYPPGAVIPERSL